MTLGCVRAGRVSLAGKLREAVCLFWRDVAGPSAHDHTCDPQHDGEKSEYSSKQEPQKRRAYLDVFVEYKPGESHGGEGKPGQYDDSESRPNEPCVTKADLLVLHAGLLERCYRRTPRLTQLPPMRSFAGARDFASGLVLRSRPLPAQLANPANFG